MNIDLAALRALEREREIPFDTILAAIETALLTAYRHTDGAEGHARVEIDRKNGAALVFAQELDADGTVVREWDDTPHDFGRIAARIVSNGISRSRSSARRAARSMFTPRRLLPRHRSGFRRPAPAG